MRRVQKVPLFSFFSIRRSQISERVIDLEATASGGNIPIFEVARHITCNRQSVTIHRTPVTGQKSVDSLQLEMALNVIDNQKQGS